MTNPATDDPHPTPKSCRTLPTELSIAVLESLERVETLCKTAVRTGESLLREFSDLHKRFDRLERKNQDLEARIESLEEWRKSRST